MPRPSVMTVPAAHAFFKAAHAGQTDQQGRDYYTHHLAPIAAAVEHLGDIAIIAALGHDYIEDVHHGDVDSGIAALRPIGCPEEAIAAIVSVTRLPSETYPDLITRSCADPLGVHIKLADNEHNILSGPALATADPKKALSLLTKRYLPARDRLIEARTLHALGMPPGAGTEVRSEYRIQQQRDDVGWVDLCPLPHGTNVDEALADLADLPTRRLVKVAVYETVEVVL